MKKAVFLLAALTFGAVLSTVSVYGDVSSTNIDRDNNIFGGDSLGAAADTTGAYAIPGSYNNFAFLALADDSVIVTVQFSPDTSSWNTWGVDTVLANAPDTLAGIPDISELGNWYYRVILANTSADTTTAQAWTRYTR